MSMGLSDGLEKSVKEYSKYLLEVAGYKSATDIEFAGLEMIRKLQRMKEDVWTSELPTHQLLEFLADAHYKTLILNIGIDPFTLAPLVKNDGDEISF